MAHTLRSIPFNIRSTLKWFYTGLLLLPGPVLAEPSSITAPVPHLSGMLEISVANGTIEADVTIGNLPRVQDYTFQLNSGLNIHNIRSEDHDTTYHYRRTALPDRFYESLGYWLPGADGDSKYLPKALRWKYAGKYPVIDALENPASNDWKGNIAFNGKTLRADGMQTAWFPQLYDKKNEKLFYEVTYDLKIRCGDCRSIFLNGSHPVRGTEAHLISPHPVEPLLLLGDFPFSAQAGNVLVNSTLSAAEAKRALARLTAIKQRMAKLLGWQIDGGLTFLSTTPVSKSNAWMWVSIPSIVSVDHDDDLLAGLLSDDPKERISKSEFAAHELAHVFLGTRRQFNSDFGFILSESLAEYLSVLVIEGIFDSRSVDAVIESKLNRISQSTLYSLMEIADTGNKLNTNSVRYQQAPVSWLLLEREIGKKAMSNWIQMLLTKKTPITDYDFAVKALRLAINDDVIAESIIRRHFESTMILEEALNDIEGIATR